METPLYSAENATRFEFVSYAYAPEDPEIRFNYKVHFKDVQPLTFVEKVIISDTSWVDKLPEAFMKAMLDDLHLVLGISYYKLFCPEEFILHDIHLNAEQVSFWNTLYTKGLGEFLYRNGLDPKRIASFSADASVKRLVTKIPTSQSSLLVGVGGGKDSIVSLELLKEYERTGFVVETGKENPIAQEVAGIAHVPLTRITRALDPRLIEGIGGAYNGHVPISAVYAFLGVLQAAIDGHGYIVVSNEHSSNFGNLMHEGNEVNHQWSKSSEFEGLFQTYVRENLTTNISYFSLLRPFYELRIVEMFTKCGRDYFNTFSSCNRNFAHIHEMGSSRWCGKCPKCAFAFLMLSAFLKKEEVLDIFKKDMFADTALLPLFKDILGFGTMKPFDCVGTFDESRVAFSMAKEQWSGSYMVEQLSPLFEELQLSTEVFTAQQALTVPSRFRLLGMQSALILGYGKEGHANELYMHKLYPQVRLGIADQKDGDGYLEKQNDYDVVLKTPIIPAAQVTRQYVTATQLFFAQAGRGRIVGVTGSKGKSTTATLIYLMLKKAGVHVRLVGNIGLPALQEILNDPIREQEIFVFELSSYQLEDLDVSPHIAVVTSLFPEHLDHHGSLEAYYGAKQNIINFQDEDDVFVFAEEFPQLETWAEHAHAVSVALERLPFTIQNKALRGEHMRSNAELAYTVGLLFGLSKEDAEEVIDSFEGLPHRLQHVGTFKGIEFYDDSISTTPESSIAGIRALGNVETIILGGVDRGYSFDELEKELRARGVRNVVLFPESGEHMLASETGFDVLHTSNMDEAVRFAYVHTAAGKSCLLSPAAPSYNLFTNFEERGNAFAEAVKKYGYH